MGVILLSVWIILNLSYHKITLSTAQKNNNPYAPHQVLYTPGQGYGTIEQRKKAKLLKRHGDYALDERLIYEILAVVAEIPVGSVATYGQIARLIGREKNARLVGRVLRMAQYYGTYPCHRVVNHAGRLVPGWSEQQALLHREGVRWRDQTHVDLRYCQWEC